MLMWLKKEDKTKIHNFNLKYFSKITDDEIQHFKLWLHNLQTKEIRTKYDDIMQIRIEYMINDFNSMKKAGAI